MTRHLQAVVRVSSRDAAAAFVNRHCCRCAGPWTVISAAEDIPQTRPFASRRHGVMEKVSLRCDVCGSTTMVTFRLPQGSRPVSPDTDSTDASDREQHYIFAHRLLRDRVFADPEGFAVIMRQSHARDWLVRLWERAYEETAAVVPSLDATGLDVAWNVLADRDCLIITMPFTERSPEAVAVAIMATHGEWRYFPFERLGSGDDARTVLCEWRADGSRCNHDLVAGRRTTLPNIHQLLEVLEEQLEDEEEQEADGQPPLGDAYWKPGSEEPSLEASLGTFRRQPCIFAFHVLPAAIADFAEELADQDEGRRSKVLLQLWRRAADPEQDEAGSAAPVRSTVQEVDGDKLLVIELPLPVAPPEPRFVAVRISTAGRRHCEPPVYTLERSSRRRGEGPILGRVSSDLEHDIIGCLPDEELGTFLSAITGKITPTRGVDTLSQLMRYVMVQSESEGDEG